MWEEFNHNTAWTIWSLTTRQRKVWSTILIIHIFIKYQVVKSTCRFEKLDSGPGMNREGRRGVEAIWLPSNSRRNSLCLLCSSFRRLLSWACSSEYEWFLRWNHTYTHTLNKNKIFKWTIIFLYNKSCTSSPRESQFLILLSWLPEAESYPEVSSL